MSADAVETHRTDEIDEPTETDDEPLEFGLAGVRAGFIACIPVALGVAGYGVAFGVLARQVGLTLPRPS